MLPNAAQYWSGYTSLWLELLEMGPVGTACQPPGLPRHTGCLCLPWVVVLLIIPQLQLPSLRGEWPLQLGALGHQAEECNAEGLLCCLE